MTLKNVWKDGTRALLLEPQDLLVRLCAAVPPPWCNLFRYFGVLSSRSRWSWLLRRVFRAELETCRRCGGAMRWVEVATEQGALGRLLAKHGLAPQPPPATWALAPLGQLVLPFNR